MYVFFLVFSSIQLRAILDIIILLVVGVILVIFFFLWQRYLEKVQNTFNAPYSFLTPPPLMKPSMWTRAKGRFAVMMFVAFLTWCSFLSWAFWVQVVISFLVRPEFSYGHSTRSCIIKISSVTLPFARQCV